MKTFVEVRLDVPGFHRYPHAPEPVQFLADRHRHIFKVRVRVWVAHRNRAVEFVTLKTHVANCVDQAYTAAFGGYEFGDRSCEQIAKELWGALRDMDYRPVEIGVSEDGEFEGIVC